MTDAKTLAAYEKHAQELARQYAGGDSSYVDRLKSALPQPGRVLDVGAGSGIELASLLAAGHQVTGLEPSAAMRMAALDQYPELKGRFIDGSLPEGLPSSNELRGLGGEFDAVVCSAVLQHLPRGDLFDAVLSLRRVLKAGGRAVVSVPSARDDLDAERRDPLGRFYSGIAPGELRLLFERAGFHTLKVDETGDSLGRSGVRWTTLTFELLYDEGSPRPLERVETVIRHDKRSASYKLALLRALTDVATTMSRKVRWRERQVGVPIDLVVDLWISYYWPLLYSEKLIPQSGGEVKAGRSKLGFAKEMAVLIDLHRDRRSDFLSALRRDELSSESQNALGKLRSSLRRVIIVGPVHFAGRSTSTDKSPLFDYDKENKEILVDESLWRELSMMSHWVQDSLLLRWAEFSRALAQSSLGEAEGKKVFHRALALLLEPTSPERDTAEARRIYESSSELSCVWRGGSLKDKDFHVDHAIPYALWHNNDLWNLLPASQGANSSKSDKLPSRALLKARRSAILDSWGQLSDAAPKRFNRELGNLSGSSGQDFELGFDALMEAIEVTALQRGCERWEG